MDRYECLAASRRQPQPIPQQDRRMDPRVFDRAGGRTPRREAMARGRQGRRGEQRWLFGLRRRGGQFLHRLLLRNELPAPPEGRQDCRDVQPVQLGGRLSHVGSLHVGRHGHGGRDGNSRVHAESTAERGAFHHLRSCEEGRFHGKAPPLHRSGQQGGDRKDRKGRVRVRAPEPHGGQPGGLRSGPSPGPADRARRGPFSACVASTSTKMRLIIRKYMGKLSHRSTIIILLKYTHRTIKLK
mmetsp:Transcript_7872/g.19536  ORF Transcript_7872/g.19536 Transcript_7872/m.19536 type:complete len:241 (-) Transcript_7872:31-753(-)